MSSDIETFWQTIDGIMVCMVTTHDGKLMRARPMAPFVDAEARALRFVTDGESAKMMELQDDPLIALAFADQMRQTYVSVSGYVQVNRDEALIKKLWGPYTEAFFGGSGPENADVAVLEVTPVQAEIWDSTTNPFRFVGEMAKALISEDGPNLGENRKIDFGEAAPMLRAG